MVGVQWLSIFDPMLWDFEALIMEFSYKGNRVVLRGTRKSVVEWVSEKKLQQDCDSFCSVLSLANNGSGDLNNP